MSDNNNNDVSAPQILTGVEHSDGRLAAVEEAKRTGLEFQSTSSEGGDIVPYDVAVEAGTEWSNKLVADAKNVPSGVELSVRELIELNEQKAEAHENYSKGVMNRRANVKPMERTERINAVLERNAKVADQHEQFSNELAENRINEERAFLRAEQVGDSEPQTALGKRVKEQVESADENEEREMFADKQRVTYGEESYNTFTDEKKSQKETRTEERNIPAPHNAGKLTNGGRNTGKDESTSPPGPDAHDEPTSEQKRAAMQAEREQDKSQREQKREQDKQKREEKREQEKAQRGADKNKGNDSGDSQE